jgi:apolipoprotein N-acyltransferase
MSLFWGTFSYACFNFFKKTGLIFLPFYCASVFTLTEYLRAWFFGILWLGRGSLLGPHWTIGNPAYLLVNLDPIRQSASYWGIYGIDFLIIFFAIAIFLLVKFWHKGHKIILSLEVLSIIIILAFVSISSKESEIKNNRLTISIIQTQTSTELLSTPEKLLIDFSRKNDLLKEASEKSDIVIFPESTNFSNTLLKFLDFASAQKYFTNLSPKKILITDSIRIQEQEGLKSKIILIDSKDGIVDSYDKKLITPGGESIPYLSKLPLWATEYLWRNDFISSKATFYGGTGSNVLKYQDNKIKFLVCSDIISPSLSRENKFNFIINPNNLAVFGGGPIIERQLLSMAKFRAVENRKYLALASNFGHSYIINEHGNIEESTNTTGYQILTGDIVPNTTRTWYNRLGDWPILLLSLAVFGLYVRKNKYDTYN